MLMTITVSGLKIISVQVSEAKYLKDEFGIIVCDYGTIFGGIIHVLNKFINECYDFIYEFNNFDYYIDSDVVPATPNIYYIVGSQCKEDSLTYCWSSYHVANHIKYLIKSLSDENRKERSQKSCECVNEINLQSLSKAARVGVIINRVLEVGNTSPIIIGKAPRECKFLFITTNKTCVCKPSPSIDAIFGFLTAMYSQSEVEMCLMPVCENDPNLFDSHFSWSDAIIIERGIENPNVRPICKASGKPVYFYTDYAAMCADLSIFRDTLKKQGLI